MDGGISVEREGLEARLFFATESRKEMPAMDGGISVKLVQAHAGECARVG